MNSSPIRLRLSSGSRTPASASKNRSAAFTWTSSIWNWRRKVSSTCSASPARMSPVSTNTQVSWSPTALWTSAAATAESTPPLSAHSTRSPPTWARTASTLASMIETWVQPAGDPHTSWANLAMNSEPRAVWTTSGWNWTPKIRRSWSPNAATGEPALLARTSKPGRRLGHRVAVAHPDLATRPASRRTAARQPASDSSVRPYSPLPVCATVPPSCWAISWAP